MPSPRPAPPANAKPSRPRPPAAREAASHKAPPAPVKNSALRFVPWSIVLLGLLLAGLQFEAFPVGGYADDADYIVLAQSLSSGRGYRLINFPNAPIEPNFPPGWPILLAPLVKLFPNSFGPLKALSLAFYFGSLLLAFRLLKSRLPSPYPELALALFVLNPITVSFAGMVMSEMAFTFFALGTLLLWESWREKPHSPLLALTVAAACWTAMVRTAGLSLVLALLLWLIFTRKWRDLALAAGVAAFGLAPQLWINHQTGGGLISSGYARQTGASPMLKLAQMGHNARDYADGVMSNLLLPVFGAQSKAMLSHLNLGGLLTVLNWAIVLLAILGFALSLRDRRPTELFAACYALAILSFWNPGVGSTPTRFLLPLLPLLAFYSVRAGFWTADKLAAPGLAPRLVLAPCTLLLLLLIGRNLQAWRHPPRDQITEFRKSAVWARRYLPRDAVLMARNPVSTFLYARRKTVYQPAPGQDVAAYVKRWRVTHIQLSPKLEAPRTNRFDGPTREALLPFVRANRGRLKAIYRDEKNSVVIFELTHKAT